MLLRASRCVRVHGARAHSSASRPVNVRVGVAVTIFPRFACGRVDTSAILLIKRGTPPGEGLWCFPGGKQELGETLAAAAEREALEETGVKVCVMDVVCPAYTATDVIYKDADGCLTYHYAIVHVLSHVSAVQNGDLPAAVHADDASEARWFSTLAPGSAADSTWRGLTSLHEVEAAGLLVPHVLDVVAKARRVVAFDAQTLQ